MVNLHKRQLISVFVVHPRDATTNPAFIDIPWELAPTCNSPKRRLVGGPF